MKKLNGWGRWERTLPASRPCELYGLAPWIRIDNNPGRYCLYYGTRIPQDGAREMGALREVCIKGASHFVWPIQGNIAIVLSALKVTMADWRLKVTILKVPIVVALVWSVLTPIGLMFSPNV